MLRLSDRMTLADILNDLTQHLTTYSSTPRLDAELLITYALEKPRSYIYTYPERQLEHDALARILSVIERRAKGEPLAYILGYKDFWSLELTVTHDTLIPRPETEHLVEWMLEHLSDQSLRIADLGTGSGAIAIALAHERPQWHIDATDTSAAALTVAIQNAQQYQLNNIAFYLGSWCAALPDKHYHVIVSNPPYIAADDPHLYHLGYEPLQALVADNAGLAAIEAIITNAKDHLVEGGLLILEHGYNQAQTVQTLMRNAEFKTVQTFNDLAHQPRFTTGVRMCGAGRGIVGIIGITT